MRSVSLRLPLLPLLRWCTLLFPLLRRQSPVDAASQHEPEPDVSTSEEWFYILCCGVLVAFAGVMSGLTVGLMSIDPLKLELLRLEGSEVDMMKANRVHTLLQKHHLLLVTLLLANSAAMEALPLFLDKLVPSWLAVVISVSLVLLFGEVLPQAICTKHPIDLGYRFSYLVWILMLFCYPVAWPIARLLDYILGPSNTLELFKRSELRSLVKMHGAGLLHADEVKMCMGALSLFHQHVADVMTPFKDVFMLPNDAVLDNETMGAIMAAGYTRIPVYEHSPHNIVGMLLVTRLIVIDPEDERCVSEVLTRRPMVVDPDKSSLFQLLNQFQLGQSHLAIVSNDVENARLAMMNEEMEVDDHVRVLGVVSIEDIVEALIQEEIVDEQDLLRNHMATMSSRVTQRGVMRAVVAFKGLLHRSRSRRLSARRSRLLSQTTSRSRSRSRSRRLPSSTQVSVPIDVERIPLRSADSLAHQDH